MVCLSRPYPFKFSKGCLPQILLDPFFSTLSHLFMIVIIITIHEETPNRYSQCDIQ